MGIVKEKSIFQKLKREFFEISKELEENGSSIDLLIRRTNLNTDIVLLGVGTKAKSKLNKDLGNLYRKIYDGIEIKTLEKAVSFGNCTAAWILAKKMRDEGKVTKANSKKYRLFLENGSFDTEILQIGSKFMDVGYDYLNPESIGDQDLHKAIYWLSRAIDDGDTAGGWARHYLGVAYSWLANSIESKSDAKSKKTFNAYAEQAVFNFEVAARADNDEALRNLGNIYNLGEFVKKDTKKALQKWREASKLGNKAATEIVAECYYYGDGTRTNKTKALQYYLLLGEEYTYEVLVKLARYYIEGHRLLKKGKTYGIKLLERAVKEDFGEAQELLANEYYDDYYSNNKKRKEIIKKAFDLYKKAAKNKDDPRIFAALKLGQFYLFGLGINKNSKQAEFWFRKVIEADTIENYRMQAVVYLEDYLGIKL